MLGKIEDKGRRGRQRMRWLDSITNSIDMNLSKLWEIVKDGRAWGTPVHGAVKSGTWLSDWRATTIQHVLRARLHSKQWKRSRSVLSDSLWPVDWSPPSSSVHGIFQASILEWVVISFSRGSSWPRDQTQVSTLQADTLPSEIPGKLGILVSKANLLVSS